MAEQHGLVVQHAVLQLLMFWMSSRVERDTSSGSVHAPGHVPVPQQLPPEHPASRKCQVRQTPNLLAREPDDRRCRCYRCHRRRRWHCRRWHCRHCYRCHRRRRRLDALRTQPPAGFAGCTEPILLFWCTCAPSRSQNGSRGATGRTAVEALPSRLPRGSRAARLVLSRLPWAWRW